jgi:flagellar assembly factor FliW
MAVVLHSSRFGEVEVPDDAVVAFPNGLIGLGGDRYALLARGEASPFVWLHSVDDPKLAVPMTNPWRFFPRYDVELTGDDADRLGVAEVDRATVYVTVRAAEAVEDYSANLRAPILIVGATGHQVINQAEDAPVRAPLLWGLSSEPDPVAA